MTGEWRVHCRVERLVTSSGGRILFVYEVLEEGRVAGLTLRCFGRRAPAALAVPSWSFVRVSLLDASDEGPQHEVVKLAGEPAECRYGGA